MIWVIHKARRKNTESRENAGDSKSFDLCSI